MVCYCNAFDEGISECVNYQTREGIRSTQQVLKKLRTKCVCSMNSSPTSYALADPASTLGERGVDGRTKWSRPGLVAAKSPLCFAASTQDKEHPGI